MTALLEVRNASAGYGEVRVLENVSLDVEPGSITALLGSNGAGKTTLMRLLAGLLPLNAGQIVFAGSQIAGSLPHDRVECGIALVPEGRLIFPEFSVEENLRIGAIALHARAGAGDRIEEMFALFPRLYERRRQAGGTLSGGEQQMLALARGLMSDPTLLLLDEPSLGLAPTIVADLFDMIATVRDRGVTVFIVEQDIPATLAIADSAYVLENGRIVLTGTGAELLENPSVKEAYLGL
jgi:branched-chain amino acid transport system ATP-binding protein